MKAEDLQNLALAAAAIGLAYALYRTLKKAPAKSTATTAEPSPTGALTWTNGQPTYTSFGPYDPSTLAGQLAINKLLAGAVGDLNFNGFA